MENRRYGEMRAEFHFYCIGLGRFLFQNTLPAVTQTKAKSMGFHISLSHKGMSPEVDLLAGEVFRGSVVLVRGLLVPVLTSVPGGGDSHIPSIVFAFSLQTLKCGARRWRGCCLNRGEKSQ